MKKMTNVLIVLILMGSIIPIVYADDLQDSTSTYDIDDDTQQQVEVMSDGLGAEIRLLQLEKAIIRNIFYGDQVVSILEELDINTSDLQVILAEFDLLKQEVQSADANDTDAVSIFIDLKFDAVNLTKNFRDTLRELINSSTLNQLQQRIRVLICNQIQNLSMKIYHKIRQFNENQFRRFYQIIGENSSCCLQLYKNGTMTKDQVMQNISMRVNQTEKIKQFNFLTTMKQERIQYKIRIQKCVQNASEGFQERQGYRLRMRLQSSENLSDNPIHQQLMKRIRNKLNGFDNTGTSGTQGGKRNGVNQDGYGGQESGNGEGGQNTEDQGKNNGGAGSHNQSGGGGQ